MAVMRKRKLNRWLARPIESWSMEKDLRSDDRDSKHSRLKLGIPGFTVAERRVGPSGVTTTSCQDSYSYHSRTEEDIEKDGKDGKDSEAAEKTGQKRRKGSVDDSSTSHALDRLHPCWDMLVMVCKVYLMLASYQEQGICVRTSQEVGEDAEYQGRAQKLEGA